METSSYTILELLNGSDTLYSTEFWHEYSGDAEFLDTIIEDMEYSLPQNLGVITLKGDTVVDGMQRLLTVSLLLYALCECYKRTNSKNDEARYKIFSRYLAGGKGAKIQLKGENKEIYQKIILSKKLTDEEKENRLFVVLHDFWVKIKENKVSATKLIKEIGKIKVFVVVVNSDDVDERDLYGFLNDSKIENEQINLITDFLRQESGESFVFWENTCNLYKEHGLELILNDFIKDFISISFNGKTPEKKKLFFKFKQYYNHISQYQNSEQIIQNLNTYARYYLKIVQADFEDFDIQKQFIRIKENQGQGAYSYLMEVLEDYERGHVSKEIFTDILNAINTFLDGTEGNSFNFANLGAELNKMLVKK